MNYTILGAFKLMDFYQQDLAGRHADNLLFARVNVGLHDTMVLDAMEELFDFVGKFSSVGYVQPVVVGAGVRVEIVGVAS